MDDIRFEIQEELRQLVYEIDLHSRSVDINIHNMFVKFAQEEAKKNFAILNQCLYNVLTKRLKELGGIENV